jgi:GDP-L-fucose synthase
MSYYTNKTIIITGSTGILGQNLVKRLSYEGANIYALIFKRRILKYNGDGITIGKIDLRNYVQTLEYFNWVKPDIVINAAAVIKGAKGQKTGQLQLVRDNITIGVNVISAAVECGAKKFGFVGSSTMYPDWDFVKECDGFTGEPWEGYSGVGNMKRYLEKVCMQFHRQSDTKFAIARTTALYGPHDDFNLETCHVIPALVNKIANIQNPLEVWGDGSEQRNFVYVEDFVDGFLKMVELKADADPVNITSGEVSTVKDVIKYACDHVGYSPIINYDSTKPTMIPRRIVSVQKAKDILEWEAKVNIKEGIEKTIDWYRNNYIKA